jgi:hypothetical protein
MLSKQEEHDINFLDRSKAVLLEAVSDALLPAQIQKFADRIVQLDYGSVSKAD